MQSQPCLPIPQPRSPSSRPKVKEPVEKFCWSWRSTWYVAALAASVVLAGCAGSREGGRDQPLTARRLDEGGCDSTLHRAPTGPYAFLLTCEDALGAYGTVLRTGAIGAPLDGAWEIGQVAWHDPQWGSDLTSFMWGRDGNTLYVSTGIVYGTGGVYALQLRERRLVTLVPPDTTTAWSIRGTEQGGRTIVLVQAFVAQPETLRVPAVGELQN